MKKLTFITISLLSLSTFAFPRGCPPPPHGPHHRPPPPPPVHHHHHHSDGSFWSGFAGAAVGTVIGNAIVNSTTPQTVVTQPVVVQQPVVVTQPQTVVVQQSKVWVEGRYVDQVQSNGTVVRVWVAGHYE